jgi:hypothetical protein
MRGWLRRKMCCSLTVDVTFVSFWLVAGLLSVGGRHNMNFCPSYHVSIMASLELAGMLPITPWFSSMPTGTFLMLPFETSRMFYYRPKLFLASVAEAGSGGVL